MAGLANAPRQFASIWGRIDINQKIAILLVGLGSVGAVVGLLVWSGRPNYGLLYSNLSRKDAAAVAGELQKAGIEVISTEEIFVWLARRLRPDRIALVGDVAGVMGGDATGGVGGRRRLSRGRPYTAALHSNRPKRSNNVGSTNRLSSVDVVSPPTITSAIGPSISRPGICWTRATKGWWSRTRARTSRSAPTLC